MDKCIVKSEMLLQKLFNRQSLLFFISQLYIRVHFQNVWHCISQCVSPLNDIAVHLGLVSA